MIIQFIVALILSGFIVALAYWRGSLSQSGAFGALIVGTLTFGLGGWQWGIILALFFISSSLLSHYKEAEKKEVAEKFDKGHRRDIGQVFANGGLGTIVAVLSALFPSPYWFPMFVGVMGTVTADTWATELGTLSKKPPRLITSGKVVPVGTSGGVTVYGTAVSLLGGFLIGFTAGLFMTSGAMGFVFAVAGALGGLFGSLCDSLLGATVQQIYYCDVCQKETEKKMHCGQPTRPLKGWSWMNNDLVNLLASLFGGITAVVVYHLLIINAGL